METQPPSVFLLSPPQRLGSLPIVSLRSNFWIRINPLLLLHQALIAASVELTSTRRLARVSAQLDVAAKGTYILNRDLDTISRLVVRLNDELEHMRSMVKFWMERGEGGRLQASGEVARQLRKNDASFSQQLDDLEEHLYLCFMTINRSRNLVLKEILDPSQPNSHPGI
ncbi:hypothetical protein Patl1_20171 [Pistacia atlantica]|uniref:Uncharacterized protein n=1 Tax=Pistacia atlantica TaxID=434234 RepID=A0ACC1BIE1_9ROSI|nr:hypothetical protein Patl1_20171 [Pistacia atlantica]